MRHSMTVVLFGDVSAEPRLNNTNNARVASTRVTIIEERQQQQYRTSISVEAWNENADRLAAIPMGNTVMIQGKIQNKKYQDQEGNDQWRVSVVALAIADAGPSPYFDVAEQEPGQNQRQSNNQQRRQNGPSNQRAGAGNGGGGGSRQNQQRSNGNSNRANRSQLPPTFDESEDIPF